MSTEPRRASREETKQETRRALVRAASEAFGEEGLDGPSLDAICERAGKTRGAFYVHFESRDELVAAVMEDTLSAVVDGVLGASDRAGGLAETIGRYVEFARVVREEERQRRRAVPFHQLLASCWRTPALRARLVDLLERARVRLAGAVGRAGAEGGAHPGLPPHETATLLLLLALGVLVADELELDLELDASRDALLALLGVGGVGGVRGAGGGEAPA